MMAQRSFTRPRAQAGYVMLIALLLMALLAVLGATTLSIAGVDHRIAVHNRKHMLVLNTADAGTEHARWQLAHENPDNEGLDTRDTGPDFIQPSEAEAEFGGLSYQHNLGVYWVQAIYQRCGYPPPGYSTEIGRSAFRSDYWMMASTARMQDVTDYSNINESQASTASIIRKVLHGTCKIR